MKKIINTQNTMSYSEFLRRVADSIDKSAPKNVKDMNALVSSVTKSMERSEKERERERENKSHDFIFKNRLLKVFVSLDALKKYKNWDVFIGEKSFEIRCAKYNFHPSDYGTRIFGKKFVGFAENSKSVYTVFEGDKGGLYLSRIIK